MTSRRLTLLGGFAVSGDDTPPVRGLIPQAILARLALAVGAPVTADALIADLWHDPPDEVLSSLRAHVSRLRARGWGAALSGGRDGYRLDPAGADVDLVAFERHVAGTGPDRLADLQSARRLWRDDPVGWLSAFPFAAPLAERLAVLHRRAVLELAPLLVAAGDADEAVAALETLDATPDDGDAAVALADALVRSGRPADALGILERHLDGARRGGGAAHPAAIAARDVILHGDRDASTGPDAADGVERHGFPPGGALLIGREEHLRAVEEGRGAARLVTLTGAAGVGKTRLAIEAARTSGAAVDDVQWMVDLTAAVAPDDVLRLVALAVGAAEPSVAAIEEVVCGRRALLLLDNAEHVVGGVATVCTALLGSCAGLGILVTSREALRLPGERVIAVAPLLGDHLPDAVELFLARAAEVLPAGGGPLERAEVARLCRSLDGLPLAIELAAARMDTLSLVELRASLPVAAPPHAGRHDSIDAAIAWSVRLTTPEEQQVLAQLAGFAGPFGLDAVAAVCTIANRDSRAVAVSLARRSLVHTVTGAGERRFRLLEPVKQYARRELSIADERAWRDRHLAWFRDAAESLARRLTTAQSRAARRALRDQRADYELALTWALDTGDRESAVRLVGALGRFWSERGGAADELALIDAALALPGPALPDEESAALRAAALIAALGHDWAAAAAYGARLTEASRDAVAALHPLFAATMAAHLVAFTDPRLADALLAEAEGHRARLGPDDAWAVVDHLGMRGEVERMLGRRAAALESLGESYRLAMDIGHVWGQAVACVLTGKTLLESGRPAESLAVLRTAVVRFLESDDGADAVAAIVLYASGAARVGRAELAAELLGAVEVLGPRLGHRGGAIDPGFAERTAQEVAASLGPARFREGVARGRTRSLEWVVGHLTG